MGHVQGGTGMGRVALCRRRTDGYACPEHDSHRKAANGMSHDRFLRQIPVKAEAGARAWRTPAAAYSTIA
jgi:hypothetical protein